jgi:hypothetical protein
LRDLATRSYADTGLDPRIAAQLISVVTAVVEPERRCLKTSSVAAEHP